LIVEDIIDTGKTLKYLLNYFRERGAKTVKVSSMLDKPKRRLVEISGDFVGFEVPNDFIVGYGLDYNQSYRNLPYIISSQFRSYGPKGKMVLPVFYGMRDFSSTAKIYTTNIIDINDLDDSAPRVTCTLTQGFRHQVRAHLASIGLPIYGDPLYNEKFKDFPQEKIEDHSYPLQLYAVGLSFPEPKKNFKLEDSKDYVSFLLQPPDKMIL